MMRSLAVGMLTVLIGHVAVASEPIARYHVVVTDPGAPQIAIDAWIPVTDGRLYMDPEQAWQLRRGWATFIRQLIVTDTLGRPVTVDTTADSALWHVQGGYVGRVHLTYNVDLGYTQVPWPAGRKQSGVYTDSALYTVTRALFITSSEAGPRRVDFAVPRGWAVSSPWTPVPGAPSAFIVDSNYDLLRNALVVGRHATYEITSGNVTVIVALPGAMRAAGPLVAPVVRKVVASYAHVFPNTPRTRLLLTFFYSDQDDGEAFAKSAILTTTDSVTSLGRVVWGNFVAHELFHHWNGRAMQGVETDARKYFSEGFTEYIANRTIVRDSIISPAVYLQRLQTHLALYRYFRSSRQFDSVSLQQAGANTTRYRFGVYQGGWAVAFCLDGIIREDTRERRSLDDFLRQMYNQFGITQTAYPTEAIARSASAVAGADLSDFFARYVAGTEMLPIKSCLKRMGLVGFGKPYAAELYVFRDPLATPVETARLRNLMRGD